MANALVCCGGTGAHVALSFMRLHALGHPLGCFRRESDGRPPELPDICLVDQDSGDAAPGEETAWQKLRGIIARHPSRHQWGDGPGLERPPTWHSVTPLPLGPTRGWFNPPHDRLESRFEASKYLECVASPRQRGIRYSHGMMGSPAIGSLLFRLKEYDRGPDGFNHDRAFEELLHRTGRIAVVGSGVGGTGSSVAPTLARMLAGRDGADVMAVMVLQWFRLRHAAKAERKAIRETEARNRDMIENASSGLQYYGRFLAKSVATVPVGVPESGLIERIYAGDNQQPLKESYAHAVAALCCMLHYVAGNAYVPGLYHMGAADAGRLGGGTEVPGGTLQSIANQGEVLEKTARVLGDTLAKHGNKPGRYAPAVCHAVAKASANAAAVGGALAAIAKEYRLHLAWMYEVLGVDRRPAGGLTVEGEVRGRLASSPPRLMPDASAQDLAGALFQWTADWVRERARDDEGLRPGRDAGRSAYWPPLVKSGLAVAAEVPGALTRLPSQNVDAILEGFVDPRRISQNGWPDPFAAASHFHDAVDRTDAAAMRRLELLMAGLIEERLSIERLDRGSVDSVSIDRMVDDRRRELGDDLASHVVVRTGSDNGRAVLGFSSPRTVLCPAPGVPDAAWGELWADLTGFDARTWKPGSPESWEQQAWGSAAGATRKIVAWIDACRRRRPSEAAPAWTRIFPSLRRDARDSRRLVTFGAGTELSILWDGSYVPEFLPTRDSGNLRLRDLGLPTTEDADAFLREHGTVFDESGRMQFEVVDSLSLPADEGARGPAAGSPTVRAIWRGHLDILQSRGVIVAFGEDRDMQEVHVVTHEADGSRECIVLVRTLMLDRETIRVGSVVPLAQDPLPGGASPGSGRGSRGGTLYPDLPLRSDYVDLAPSGGGQPTIRRRQGGDGAEWRLRLRGRGQDLMITVLLPAAGDGAPQHRAHWMVWPGFRTAAPNAWRAYYVYEHCTDPRLGLDVLHRDPGDERAMFRRRSRGDQRTSYPVGYDIERRVHTGGPPLAVSLRNREQDREHGIYFVPLRQLDELPARVSVGIDFGTSHSSAAAAVGRPDNREQLLGSELGARGRVALSHHISENWEHVTAPLKDIGLLARSAWMPTYARDVEPNLAGLVPTELLTIDPVRAMSKAVETWVPMLDYVIPPTGISRSDFTDHVIANFKWDTLTAFHGREKELRRIYLDRLVELAGAELLQRSGVPSNGMSFTFTYPLRTPRDQVADYRNVLRDVMGRGTESLGIDLSLTDGDGLFNESHAAQVGTGSFPEVRVVGDLGGGTLDLFISAEGRPGVAFKEVVDSVKIGGNLLLRTLASELAGRMPQGWATDEEEVAMQLAAWMRTRGARRLFGRDDGGVPAIESLQLSGFGDSAQRRRGRDIILRYFYLVGEYVARSLTAYLATHWCAGVGPADHERLRVQLYLRGNGWRLWPGDEDYRGVERAVAARVSARIGSLWRAPGPDGPAIPLDPPTCAPGGGEGHPKLDVVRNVVGRSRPDATVRDRWLSYTMVDLWVLGPEGERAVPWHGEIPFPTGGAGAKVQIDGVRPRIPLTGRGSVHRVEIGDLGQRGQLTVNSKLANADHVGPDALDLLAPVGAYVWEEAFKLAMLRKGASR